MKYLKYIALTSSFLIICNHASAQEDAINCMLMASLCIHKHNVIMILAKSSIPPVFNLNEPYLMENLSDGIPHSQNNDILEIKPIENGYLCTPKKSGTTSITFDPINANKKKQKDAREDIYVAYPSLNTVPRTLRVGEKIYIEKQDSELPLTQTNTSDDDAGNTNISSKKVNDQSFWKVSIKDSGPIHLKLENNTELIEALEPIIESVNSVINRNTRSLS